MINSPLRMDCGYSIPSRAWQLTLHYSSPTIFGRKSGEDLGLIVNINQDVPEQAVRQQFAFALRDFSDALLDRGDKARIRQLEKELDEARTAKDRFNEGMRELESRISQAVAILGEDE